MTTDIVKFTKEDEDVIRKSICPTLTPEEFILFLKVCVSSGLNPLLKQIYAITRGYGDSRKVTHQVSIDGARLVAERTGCYAPGRESVFRHNDKNELMSATAFVKKLTKDGTWHEVSATAFWDEYVVKGKDGHASGLWPKMPHVMLAKCAESAALRKAFPNELSGLYSKEEMQQADIELHDEKTEPLTPEEDSVQPDSEDVIEIQRECYREANRLAKTNPEVAERVFSDNGVTSFADLRSKNLSVTEWKGIRRILSAVRK